MVTTTANNIIDSHNNGSGGGDRKQKFSRNSTNNSMMNMNMCMNMNNMSSNNDNNKSDPSRNTDANASITNTAGDHNNDAVAGVAHQRQQPQQQRRPNKRRLARAGLSEKKLRRLEKNRLSARQCRRRKKLAAAELEKEIKVMERENLRLKLRLKIGEQADDDAQEEQDKVTAVLEEQLRGESVRESEVFATLEDFKEKFADYGRDRRNAVEYHFQHVARLLTPTHTTSVAMRVLRGGDGDGPRDAAAARDDAVPLDSPKDLFTLLVDHLRVTPQQAAELKDSRYIARDLDNALYQAVDLLKDLRQRFRDCGRDLENEFAEVRGILTPTQTARFLIWVKKNSACMHMLNELWDKTYKTYGTSRVEHNHSNHNGDGGEADVSLMFGDDEDNANNNSNSNNNSNNNNNNSNSNNNGGNIINNNSSNNNNNSNINNNNNNINNNNNGNKSGGGMGNSTGGGGMENMMVSYGNTGADFTSSFFA